MSTEILSEMTNGEVIHLTSIDFWENSEVLLMFAISFKTVRSTLLKL